MRLTQDIIRKLIKEQLQENQADRDALFSRMIDLISDIESAGLNYTSVYNDAKQAHVERKSQAREKMATAANRDDLEEEKLTKDQIKGRDKDAEAIKKSTIKQYGKEQGTDAAYAIATNIQKAKAKKKK